MLLGLCQLRPIAGDVAANLATHLRFLRAAARYGADLAAFPELSMTGYEPRLARPLAFAKDDARLAPLRAFVTASRIQALVGAPLCGVDKPRIGAAWLAINGTTRWLGKQWLHDDEQPHFEAHPAASTTIDVEANGAMRIGVAICYELSRDEHAACAFADGATGYLASVAKHAQSVEAAHSRLPEISQQHNAMTWMVNCVGPCEGFVAAGGSAAWDRDGRTLASLPSDTEAILLVDTATGAVRTAPA